MDEQPVPALVQPPAGPDEGLRRRALQKGPGLRVEDLAHEVVRGGIADIQHDGGVEGHELDEVRGAELPLLHRWGRGQGFLGQLRRRP